MQAGRPAKILCFKDPLLKFYHPRGVGVGKDHLFLSGRSSSSLVFGRVCIQISKGQSSNSCPCSESECRPHHIPPQGPKAILTPPLVKQTCLVLKAFLSNLLTYSDLPNSSKFLSLSVVPYWDFYNYLCLLHPYQLQELQGPPRMVDSPPHHPHGGVGSICRTPAALDSFAQHLGLRTTASHPSCPPGWQRGTEGSSLSLRATMRLPQPQIESVHLRSPSLLGPIHAFWSRTQLLCMEHPLKINSRSLPPPHHPTRPPPPPPLHPPPPPLSFYKKTNS